MNIQSNINSIDRPSADFLDRKLDDKVWFRVYDHVRDPVEGRALKWSWHQIHDQVRADLERFT
jgi:hypothetical protein